MQHVAFLAHSVYTIFTSYIVKRQYFDRQKSILILSDDMAEVVKIYHYAVQSGVWDIVIMLNEHGKNKRNVARQLDVILKKYEIAAFCIANLWRKATHYLSNALSAQQKLIMIDEGTATFDLKYTYNYYWESMGHTIDNFGEFHFDRVDVIIGVMPQLIKYPFDVIVKRMNIAEVFLQDKERTVSELNTIFGYQYKPIKETYMLIDNDFKDAMLNADEKNMRMQCSKLLENKKVWIKIKPCMGMAKIKERYLLGDNCVYFNEMVPFEVIYLNIIFNRDIIPDIIMFPTSIMMNIVHINLGLDIKGVRMILLYNLLLKHGVYWKEKRMYWYFLGRYLRVLIRKNMISNPKTWKKAAQLVSNYSKDTKN